MEKPKTPSISFSRMEVALVPRAKFSSLGQTKNSPSGHLDSPVGLSLFVQLERGGPPRCGSNVAAMSGQPWS